MNRSATHPPYPILLLLAAVVLVAFTGCSEDEPVAPPAKPAEPPVTSIKVLSPRANDVFDLRQKIVVTWDTVTAPAQADSVFIEYRPVGGYDEWKIVRRVPILIRPASFSVTDTAVTVFEIRLKASRETDWHLVSPLYILKSSFNVLSPRNGDTVEIGRGLQFRWTSRAPGVPDSLQPKDDTEVLIEYRLLKSNSQWNRIGLGQVSKGGYDWPLPPSITSDFEVRLRPASSPAWLTIAPIHVSTPVVTITAPVENSVYRIGADILIEWSSVTPLLESDEVLLEYYLQGIWYPIGTWPYSRHQVRWKPPFSQAATFRLGATLLRGGIRSVVYSISSADLHFDFPAGTTFPRGAPLVIPLKVDLPWNEGSGTEFLLSTDGGRTWPLTKKPDELLSEGPASACRLRARRSDLPFEDTSTIFSIPENLVDYAPLVVGQHYQYKVTERDWIIFAGSLTVGGRDHPDLHVVPTGMREFADRTEFDVTVWGGRNADTLHTVVTISKAGLCPASASFLPWSFEGLFTRLDPGADGKEYSWKNKYRFILDRSRGLVFAFGPGTPTVSAAYAAEYFFWLK
ncbi:MAG: hypothetical protein IH600_08905 [Bacteroidetes bacterium]|nr:hypothetical protein [Bacteroidota bacterium]